VATHTFDKFSALVKGLGIRFYGKYSGQDEVPLEAIEAHLLECYGGTFLGIKECQNLAAFSLFYVRSADLEWYRVLMLDEAFRPLTAAGMPPPPVASPEEVVPLIQRAGLGPEQVRRMALVGFAFSVWLTSDQVRQAVTMCESDADAEELLDFFQTEMESSPESA
jgi:hypothetical protein